MMIQGEFFTVMTDENVSNELISVIEFLQELNKDENVEKKEKYEIGVPLDGEE